MRGLIFSFLYSLLAQSPLRPFDQPGPPSGAGAMPLGYGIMQRPKSRPVPADAGRDFGSSGRGNREQAPADRKLRLKFGGSSDTWPKRIRPGEHPGSMENFRNWASSFPNEP
jgi:hypothetical protein